MVLSCCVERILREVAKLPSRRLGIEAELTPREVMSSGRPLPTAGHFASGRVEVSLGGDPREETSNSRPLLASSVEMVRSASVLSVRSGPGLSARSMAMLPISSSRLNRK